MSRVERSASRRQTGTSTVLLLSVPVDFVDGMVLNVALPIGTEVPATCAC